MGCPALLQELAILQYKVKKFFKERNEVIILLQEYAIKTHLGLEVEAASHQGCSSISVSTGPHTPTPSFAPTHEKERGWEEETGYDVSGLLGECVDTAEFNWFTWKRQHYFSAVSMEPHY